MKKKWKERILDFIVEVLCIVLGVLLSHFFDASRPVKIAIVLAVLWVGQILYERLYYAICHKKQT